MNTAQPRVNRDEIRQAVEQAGLALRGALRLEPEEQTGPLAGMRQIVLVGLIGRTGWDSFARSPEAGDGRPDPLDRWSERCLGELARHLGAQALFPFGGPPYWPFQRWAQRAEPLAPSPLGLLIHPDYGLWHSYRGALAFAEAIDWPPAAQAPSPCASCADQPCLTACPVSAFGPAGYDVAACAGWLRSPAGQTCMDQGCQARLACPVGRPFAHRPDQARFGMRAFLAARD